LPAFAAALLSFALGTHAQKKPRKPTRSPGAIVKSRSTTASTVPADSLVVGLSSVLRPQRVEMPLRHPPRALHIARWDHLQVLSGWT